MSTTLVVQAITTLMLDNLLTIPGAVIVIAGVVAIYLELRLMIRDREWINILYVIMTLVLVVNMLAASPSIWNFLKTVYYKITEAL